MKKADLKSFLITFTKEEIINAIVNTSNVSNDCYFLIRRLENLQEEKRVKKEDKLFTETTEARKRYFEASTAFNDRLNFYLTKYKVPVIDGKYKVMDLANACTKSEFDELIKLEGLMVKAQNEYLEANDKWTKN